jgi:hypothetical protein
MNYPNNPQQLEQRLAQVIFANIFYHKSTKLKYERL